MHQDTIYALSTAPGRAAIAIIRISGPACLPIYTALCPNRPPPKPRTATLRRLTHPTNPSEVLDTALLLYLPAPHTATGEDILELHVHGGPAIVRGVLDAIPRCAATKADLDTAGKDAHGYGHGRGHTTRPATPGEFTKRAFYNNILDLTEVEALGETLAAETEQQRRLALSGSSSTLTTRYEHWRSLLLYARGELEALIDFSEDQHFDESPSQLLSGTATQVAELVSQIKLHVLNAGRGELLRSGIVVALLGAPNAGKSSLLNRVVGREAAIVSGEEGTTRDIVDVSVDLGGWLVRLGDMAGVRAGLQPTGATEQTRDVNGSVSAVGEIEQEGIRRARERALQSDLVIVLISLRPTATGTVSLDLNDELLSAVRECRLAGKEMLFALNKIDLLHAQTASTKTSLSRLLSQLIQTFPETDANDVFCLSCRDADSSNADEPDAGGLQTFMAGLTRKFSAMTSAAAGLDGTQTNVSMSPAEAQSYWTASLSVTHRQSQYLRECLVHLEDFLETSGHAIAPSVKEEQELETETVLSTQHSHDSAASKSGFFDTEDTSSPSMSHKPQDARYHIDNHDDSVGEREHNAPQVLTSPSNGTTIPYSWADTSNNTADMEEIDIVTAAEHLRAAADCLAKLTGRGDGVSSGADVEDVLGVVFEK
ncbi:mitochondrial splicing system protein [Knufia obscura]|uniref:Mitochondrial splicing system protein n=1 Tax=Knufia obscura TaxID=1635080 RepID=A0ABR0S4A1_9EURO|nr:mitochondrial splicing system protein [Knufia obscura]